MFGVYGLFPRPYKLCHFVNLTLQANVLVSLYIMDFNIFITQNIVLKEGGAYVRILSTLMYYTYWFTLYW